MNHPIDITTSDQTDAERLLKTRIELRNARRLVIEQQLEIIRLKLKIKDALTSKQASV